MPVSSAWTRRGFMATAVSGAMATAAPASALFAYVGCYTSAKRYARGDGIHVFRVDEQTGAWSPAHVLGGLVNPSFLVLRKDQRFLYAAHGDEGYASAIAVESGTGRLTLLNQVETGGVNGVHLALDNSGRFLVVANYTSGSVSVLRVSDDGRLGEAVQVVALPGTPGPHRVEQASAHPHQILFEPGGRFVVVPDKGLDRIFVFGFDQKTGKLTPTAQGAGVARTMSGPRHAAFHPRLPVLWVVNEINSTIATWMWEAERGHLKAAQILSTLPAEYVGENTPSEIEVAPGGRHVYCSNRGHDSVVVYAADPATGLLSPLGWEPSRGRIPRFIGMAPRGRLLYAANEQSDTIVSWRVDAASGQLTSTGAVVQTPSPVSITFGRGA
ncbi:lactonase family protein [uncultured Paludibaculum sp.]|uniref:lactonase family protein n=1 Tax=uncultured Paludibaculum sp. TaxID=1765020 RepID=UPI002AABDFF1|nr:lactonase family protein [uncultured Paludibaculum sp.]